MQRTLRRTATRPAVCNGNTETIRRAVFSSESGVARHCRSFGLKRANIRAWVADPAGPVVVHLRIPHAARRWLAAFPGPGDRHVGAA